MIACKDYKNNVKSYFSKALIFFYVVWLFFFSCFIAQGSGKEKHVIKRVKLKIILFSTQLQIGRALILFEILKIGTDTYLKYVRKLCTYVFCCSANLFDCNGIINSWSKYKILQLDFTDKNQAPKLTHSHSIHFIKWYNIIQFESLVSTI